MRSIRAAGWMQAGRQRASIFLSGYYFSVCSWRFLDSFSLHAITSLIGELDLGFAPPAEPTGITMAYDETLASRIGRYFATTDVTVNSIPVLRPGPSSALIPYAH